QRCPESDLVAELFETADGETLEALDDPPVEPAAALGQPARQGEVVEGHHENEPGLAAGPKDAAIALEGTIVVAPRLRLEPAPGAGLAGGIPVADVARRSLPRRPVVVAVALDLMRRSGCAKQKALRKPKHGPPPRLDLSPPSGAVPARTTEWGTTEDVGTTEAGCDSSDARPRDGSTCAAWRPRRGGRRQLRSYRPPRIAPHAARRRWARRSRRRSSTERGRRPAGDRG